MAHDDQTFPERSGVSAFGSLAMEVVSVLNARQVGHHANRARPYIRTMLDRRLTAKASFSAADVLEELRALKLSDIDIIDHYIPDAARAMGARWLGNEIGFADVTIAGARLQSLLAEIEFDNPAGGQDTDCPFDVLVVSGEREQHTLGLFVAAAQLRRRGAVVETICGAAFEDVGHRIRKSDFDAVLISSSRPQDLENINRLAIETKADIPAAPIFALGGIVTEATRDFGRLGGLDLITSEIELVLKACARKSTRQPKRASR